jgi:hypothetical protein
MTAPLEPGHEALALGLAVTTVVLTTGEEERVDDVDTIEDEATDTFAILAPQTLPLENGAPIPFFK